MEKKRNNQCIPDINIDKKYDFLRRIENICIAWLYPAFSFRRSLFSLQIITRFTVHASKQLAQGSEAINKNKYELLFNKKEVMAKIQLGMLCQLASTTYKEVRKLVLDFMMHTYFRYSLMGNFLHSEDLSRVKNLLHLRQNPNEVEASVCLNTYIHYKCICDNVDIETKHFLSLHNVLERLEFNLNAHTFEEEKQVIQIYEDILLLSKINTMPFTTALTNELYKNFFKPCLDRMYQLCKKVVQTASNTVNNNSRSKKCTFMYFTMKCFEGCSQLIESLIHVYSKVGNKSNQHLDPEAQTNVSYFKSLVEVLTDLTNLDLSLGACSAVSRSLQKLFEEIEEDKSCEGATREYVHSLLDSVCKNKNFQFRKTAGLSQIIVNVLSNLKKEKRKLAIDMTISLIITYYENPGLSGISTVGGDVDTSKVAFINILRAIIKSSALAEETKAHLKTVFEVCLDALKADSFYLKNSGSMLSHTLYIRFFGKKTHLISNPGTKSVLTYHQFSYMFGSIIEVAKNFLLKEIIKPAQVNKSNPINHNCNTNANLGLFFILSIFKSLKPNFLDTNLSSSSSKKFFKDKIQECLSSDSYTLRTLASESIVPLILLNNIATEFISPAICKIRETESMNEYHGYSYMISQVIPSVLGMPGVDITVKRDLMKTLLEENLIKALLREPLVTNSHDVIYLSVNTINKIYYLIPQSQRRSNVQLEQNTYIGDEYKSLLAFQRSIAVEMVYQLYKKHLYPRKNYSDLYRTIILPISSLFSNFIRFVNDDPLPLPSNNGSNHSLLEITSLREKIIKCVLEDFALLIQFINNIGENMKNALNTHQQVSIFKSVIIHIVGYKSLQNHYNEAYKLQRSITPHNNYMKSINVLSALCHLLRARCRQNADMENLAFLAKCLVDRTIAGEPKSRNVKERNNIDECNNIELLCKILEIAVHANTGNFDSSDVHSHVIFIKKVFSKTKDNKDKISLITAVITYVLFLKKYTLHCELFILEMHIIIYTLLCDEDVNVRKKAVELIHVYDSVTPDEIFENLSIDPQPLPSEHSAKITLCNIVSKGIVAYPSIDPGHSLIFSLTLSNYFPNQADSNLFDEEPINIYNEPVSDLFYYKQLFNNCLKPTSPSKPSDNNCFETFAKGFILEMVRANSTIVLLEDDILDNAYHLSGSISSILKTKATEKIRHLIIKQISQTVSENLPSVFRDKSVSSSFYCREENKRNEFLFKLLDLKTYIESFSKLDELTKFHTNDFPFEKYRELLTTINLPR